MSQRFGQLATVAVVAVIAITQAAAQEYTFRHYGAAEGLQNLSVLSLAQTQDGFIWVGTEGGLYRYDGTQFRSFGVADGLDCGGEVHTLYASPDGALWANTCSKLYRYDGNRFRAVEGIDESFNQSQNMTVTETGELLVGMRKGLKVVAKGGDGVYRAREHPLTQALASQRVRFLLRQDGMLWFGCDRSLCRERKGEVERFGADQGLPASNWDAAAFERDGTLWVRSQSQLYRKRPGAARFEDAGREIGHSMYWGYLQVSADGSLLVPTDRGIYLRRQGKWILIDESRGLRSSIACCALVDRQGALWTGLVGAGLARSLGWGQWEHWTKKSGLISNVVWNVARASNGDVIVGTAAGISLIRDGAVVKSWTRRDGLPGDTVRWVGETRDGSIWAVLRPGGLVRINRSTGAVTRIGKRDGIQSESVDRGLVSRDGRLWVVGDGGAFHTAGVPEPGREVRFESEKPDSLKDMKDSWWALTEDLKGGFWFTGMRGMWSFRNGTWQNYQENDWIKSTKVYHSAVAPDGSIWFRHRYDSGVDRMEFDPATSAILSVKPVVQAQAKNNNDLTAFHGFDKAGRFYRGTSAGIHVLDRDKWTLLTAEDGLVWNDTDGEAFSLTLMAVCGLAPVAACRTSGPAHRRFRPPAAIPSSRASRFRGSRASSKWRFRHSTTGTNSRLVSSTVSMAKPGTRRLCAR